MIFEEREDSFDRGFRLIGNKYVARFCEHHEFGSGNRLRYEFAVLRRHELVRFAVNDERRSSYLRKPVVRLPSDYGFNLPRITFDPSKSPPSNLQVFFDSLARRR